MIKGIIRILVTIVAISFTIISHAQENGNISIQKIIIEGNEHTKPHIITRELNFKEGDELAINDTTAVFLYNRNKIFNTGLFIYVDFKFEKSNLIIKVKERWYVFPVPILELADRNFNEWWQQRDRDFGRLEYGVRLYHNNFRGRNERLKLVLQHGFTPKYELFYTFPYINKKLKTGIKFSISYSQNKQVAFQTVDHKLSYMEGNGVIRKRFYSGISLLRRKKIHALHQLDAFFRHNWIADTVLVNNGSYFANGSNLMRYFQLKYTYDYDKRDIRYYPLNGERFLASIDKSGLGLINELNMLEAMFSFSGYKAVGKKSFMSNRMMTKLKFGNIPYFNIRGLGYYEDLVRGYELFPMDGEVSFLTRNEFKYQLFNRRLKMKLPFTHFETIPFGVYLKGYVDGGFVDNQYNLIFNQRFSNQFLLGYGIGIDIVTYYDLVARFELSMNREGAAGFFLHFKAAI